MSDPTQPNGGDLGGTPPPDAFPGPAAGPPPGSWAPPPVAQPGFDQAGYPPPGYGQQSYGQQGYGAPGYGGAGYPTAGYQGTREHPQGTTILVLGILSLVFCGVLGPVAWVMGNSALREIDASPGTYSNRGQVQAGRICGIITSVLIILGIVLVLVLVVAGAASTTSSGY